MPPLVASHKVHAVLTFDLLDIRPVGVVAAEWRVDLKQGRQFGEHQHLVLLVERLGEGALDPDRVIDHIVVQALARHIRLPSVLQLGVGVRQVVFNAPRHGHHGSTRTNAEMSFFCFCG